MKKKIIALIVLVVLVLSVALTGCTFIKVNEERKANEIMATVSTDYNGQTLSLTVTRNELLSYVNYIINLYSQYGMSFDAASIVDQGLDSLINQKYLVLEGMKYLLSIEERKAVMYMNTNDYKNVYGDAITPEGVLTMAERYASIASTNETFKSNIETYIKDYNNEKRELEISKAKETLANHYANGYTVREEGGVVIGHFDSEKDKYEEGLYQTSFIYDKDVSVEPDYEKIAIKINVVKSGSADKDPVWLPVSSSAVTTEEKENPNPDSLYVTEKVCKVTYDEPYTDENGDAAYRTHTAEADFTLVTPRTAYVGEKEEDETDLTNGDVPYRYATEKEFIDAANFSKDSDLKKIYYDGAIFVHTKEKYDTDAEKDAYRQFRENKKSMNINFESTIDDCYNGLGYYYLSSFESAVLSAVKHELKKASLSEDSGDPISSEAIAAQYKMLVEKQKEEYSVLSEKEQINKFATTVKSDLTSAYYVPIDALLNGEFEYDDNDMNYAVDNGDGTYTINFFYIAHILFKWTEDVKDPMDRYLTDRSDEEVKEIKTKFLAELKTDKSKLDFATAKEKKEDLSDVFDTDENGKIKKYEVLEVVAELQKKIDSAVDPLALFKDYMTYFNDDSGSMSSALGYFVPMGDIDHGYDGDDFPDMAKNLYLAYLEAGVAPDKGNDISEFAFTSYGLHIEYISFAPFYNITLDENGGLGYNFVIDLDGTTFADSIKKNLEEERATNVYNEWSKEFSADKAKSHSTKDSKKMKNLLKDLGLD